MLSMVPPGPVSEPVKRRESNGDRLGPSAVSGLYDSQVLTSMNLPSAYSVYSGGGREETNRGRTRRVSATTSSESLSTSRSPSFLWTLANP